ncbi:hypothetical protein [Methylobacterium tarhaniae]|uniref:hypothetical protein n=1 Tax=Methylobacterium tarhaniae TaxID=1187852 RepID=UPI000A6DC0B6|nr:hypothetical protein [Methylobacterium tarhaniae]
MVRNLVVARVGRNSLHRCWIDPGKAREWDLYLCPFQDIASQEDLPCTVGEVLPGPKWTGLRTLLNGWDGWRDYDYIWLPDDEILADQDTITAMFAAGRALDFQLFAPGLHEASHFAHYIAMRNRRFFARRVGFVEIMIPCFSRAALDRLLPTLDLSTTGWGWGLDSLWPKLLDDRGLGIIDGVPVLHTRPVGQFRDAELGRRVMAESDRILADHGCGQRMVTFAGVDPDGRDLVLSPYALLTDLVEGWRYLFERDPRILHWIVAQQEPFFPWPSYAVAGSPTSPR